MVVSVAGSEDEIDARLRRLAEYGRWSRMTGPTEDGRKVLRATNLINAPPTNVGRTIALFDLHPRLSTWTLTARWRTEELMSETVSCLAAWHLVAAAATARALLESTLAFVGEARGLEEAWSAMKLRGPPDLAQALRFRAILDAPLTQAQYATRSHDGSKIEDAEKARRLERRNVLTLMKHGVKVAQLDKTTVDRLYGELSNAAHPSGGSQWAYVIGRDIHPTGAQMVATVGRGLAAVQRRGTRGHSRPEVATSVVQALSLALETFNAHWPAFVGVVDDFGLTTEVPFRSRLNYWRRHTRPAPNDPCPCRASVKWKKCRHQWGEP